MTAPRRRVVVTGLGVVTPNGLTINDFWQSLCEPKSSASFIERFSTEGLPTKIGCVIKNFDPGNFLDPKAAKRMDISYLFGIAAAKNAVCDSGLTLTNFDPDRIGVVEGTSIGGMNSALSNYDAFIKKGHRGLSPFALINAYTGGGSSEIALALGISGHTTTICTACSSGSDAIGYALKSIQDDEADIMIAGATEAPVIPGYWGIFCAAKSMSKEDKEPSHAMKPFHKLRDGFILGEGAAFLILEELSIALDRKAKIYAEVIGYGRGSDSFHSVAQHPEGRGAKLGLQRALRLARISPEEIDYINVHGSATPSNDIVETIAIKTVFGDHAAKLQISATKPVTGHLAGASGAVEAAICVLAIERSTIPPTMNLDDPDPQCDLDCVPNIARSYPVRTAINMSAGFGGKNASLIFRSMD